LNNVPKGQDWVNIEDSLFKFFEEDETSGFKKNSISWYLGKARAGIKNLKPFNSPDFSQIQGLKQEMPLFSCCY